MKYRPDFPPRFGCLEEARAHCQAFFTWYNTIHRHSGIAYMTPHSVHYGQADAMLVTRQTALDAAFRRNPNRFKGKNPRPLALPQAVWINPPSNEKKSPTANADLLTKLMTTSGAKSLTRSAPCRRFARLFTTTP